MRSRYFFLLLILSAVLIAAGCGKKTMVVPPQGVAPAAISDLAYSLDENGLSLSWSLPRKTVNGDDLDRVETFQILRAIVPLAEYCPGCPQPFELIASVAGGEVEGDNSGFISRYRESSLKAQYHYSYKVRPSKGRWFVGQDSAVVSFSWDTPPGIPLDPRIKSGDRILMVSWQPPTALADGRPVSGQILYQLYRSYDGIEFTALGEPVTGTSYVDETVVNDKLYFYQLRALRRYEETLLPGAAGEVTPGIARDLVAPGPPLNLVVVVTATGVRLSWEGGAEEDLAGFRVYRRRANESEPQVAGEVMAPVTVFTDTENLPGRAATWYYSITAFDQAAPPNESAFSVEAVVIFE